jgi:hypothetical protein
MTSETQDPPTSASVSDYPVNLEIDYADGGRNRLTVFFRIVTIIPILLVSTGLTLLIWPIILMMLFRQKYPKWWFDFNLEYLKFSTRVGAYWGLQTDQYPSTDEEQSVHLTIEYPDSSQLNRFLPLFKWILAIPHYIALAILLSISSILVLVGWFIILFTGKLPRGIHDYLVGVTRWTVRVQAYAFMMATDKYPPFSLK